MTRLKKYYEMKDIWEFQ